MKPIPWSQVKNWQCVGCGQCCKLQVQLTTKEWLNLSNTFGHAIVGQNIDGFHIRKTVDNWCPFIYRYNGGSRCILQQTKPLACQLWPLRISNYPRYGNRDAARFSYRNGLYFVYVIPYCQGISYGRPTEFFTKNVIPEFIDIRLGFRTNQNFTTRKLPLI